MPKPARERLAHLLSGAQPTHSDSATLRLPGDALTLEVSDVGSIPIPIRAAQAKRLIAGARPARFGRGEETLNDNSVRDTWELTPDQVHLEGPRWSEHLDAALEHFCDALGLPHGSRLTAELHSLLVYGKGQFFLPHQDSEKHETMVASLVVMLPSVHTGGELVVDDGGQERIYRGSRDELVLVAFFADRRHEVRPVRSGHRVTLTFNLLLESSGEPTGSGPASEAAAYLTEHFTTRSVSRYGARDRGVPSRLAFLLDHEYTQHGLAARRLKGADAERVSTLLAAVEEAQCEAVFALAEIKETWSAEPAGDYWHPHWQDDEDEEPDGYEQDDDDYALTDLIDDEIVLGWWTTPDGSSAETIRLPLGDDEVCAATPTKSLKPYQSEYEGYMGNYGNTMDRWYRRAAVVVWPKRLSFSARAEAAPEWALRSLLERIDAGDLEGARTAAATMEPFWLHMEPEVVAPALRVAAGIQESRIAAFLAAPFQLEMLTAAHAPLLATLASSYGSEWMLALLDRWDTAHRFATTGRLPWITDELLPLCRALREHEAHEIADGFVDRVWHSLESRIRTWVGQSHPERRRASLTELGAPLTRVLEAASDGLGAAIARALHRFDDNVVDVLIPALRAHQPPPSSTLLAVASDCRERLSRIVDRPARSRNDWSIAWSGCGCEVCARFAEFLSERSARDLAWPLVTRSRQHVHHQIDSAGLPVRHITKRQGRPYSLLLTKTDDLFRLDDESRRRARSDLEWLVSVFG